MARWLALAAVVVLVPGIAAADVSPSMQFEDAAVICTGFTHGGEVVLFAVSRDPQPSGESDVIQTRLAARDTDNDGIVRFDLGRPVAYLSVWSAIDVTTGAFAAGTRPPFTLRRVDWPSNAVGRDSDNSLRKLEFTGRGVVDILWVRPERGAWALTLYDGGESDEGKKNDGRIRAVLENVTTVTGDDPPHNLHNNDLLIVIDQRKLEVFAQRVRE